MKQSFNLTIQPEALEDIQEAIIYYNTKQQGLGNRFFKEVDNSLESLKKNPFFQVRYDDVRCLLVKKFPYMLHFKVDEKEHKVTIYAVVSTYQNPAKSWVKKV